MFLGQLLSEVKQNQCSAELFLTLNRNAPYTHEAFVLFFFFNLLEDGHSSCSLD